VKFNDNLREIKIYKAGKPIELVVQELIRLYRIGTERANNKFFEVFRKVAN
jgi:hypothetical protein